MSYWPWTRFFNVLWESQNELLKSRWSTKEEPAKWATATRHSNHSFCAIARFARSVFLPSSSWGSASLHPRLYASTRYAGFGKVSPH